MVIFLTMLGIYIGMVTLSLLGPYVDFRKNYCEKGKKYTLEDFYNEMENSYWAMCFIPVFNITTVVLTLVFILVTHYEKR